MAQVRNITDRTVDVHLNGHPRGGAMGRVEPDGLLDVPDEVFLAHDWPEDDWQVEDDPRDQAAVGEDEDVADERDELNDETGE